MLKEKLAIAIRNYLPEAPKDWVEEAIAAAVAVPHDGDDDAWIQTALATAVDTLNKRLAAQRARLAETLAALEQARRMPPSDTIH